MPELLKAIERLPSTGRPASLALLSELERECFPENAWTVPQIAASLVSPAFRVILIAGDGGVQEYRVGNRNGAKSATDLLTLTPPPPERVAGYALVQLLEGEGTCEILRLGIRPEFRRRGLASIVLGFLDRINANFWHGGNLSPGGPSADRHLLLEVSAGNTAAIALYRGYGFVELARRRNYYPRRDGSGASVDAIVLRRRCSTNAHEDSEARSRQSDTALRRGTTHD